MILLGLLLPFSFLIKIGFNIGKYEDVILLITTVIGLYSLSKLLELLITIKNLYFSLFNDIKSKFSTPCPAYSSRLRGKRSAANLNQLSLKKELVLFIYYVIAILATSSIIYFNYFSLFKLIIFTHYFSILCISFLFLFLFLFFSS
jgi:hypothetical protein